MRRLRRRMGAKLNALEALETRVLLAAVQPYVQNPAADAMTITWFTHSPSPGQLTVTAPGGGVVFNGSSTPVLASELAYHPDEIPLLPAGADPDAPYKHSIRVTGLTTGTLYDYTVVQDTVPYIGHFQTSPASMSSVRFIVYADSETEPESTGKRTPWTIPSAVPPGSSGRPPGLNTYVVDQTVGYRENLSLIASRGPDFVAIAGDLVESGGEQRDWDEFWRHNAGELGRLASTTPILAAPGNHENYGGPNSFGGYTDSAAIRARDKFRTYFETPDNGSGVASFEDRYFRIDYGPITYITLDVSNGLPHQSSQDTNFFLGPAPGFPDFNPGSAQYQWLEAQLADAQARSRFTFVQFHHVPYSVGPHGFPAGFGGNAAGFDTQSGVPARVLTPLFVQYGVDAVFAGHDEQYQHSLVDGIHFYDLGIGGDGLRGPSSGPDGSTGLASTNPFQMFLAHLDAPEVWNGSRMVSGGKHYGHMEVDVFLDDDGFWKAELEPVYNFPLMDAAGGIVGWERRVYDDVVVLTAPGGVATGLSANSGDDLRAGIRELTLSFDQPVMVPEAAALTLFNQTTGQSVSLSGATLAGNGSDSITWILADGPGGIADIELPNGRYTAELAATTTTPRLAETFVFEFFRLAGDVDGDGLVNFNDYFAVRNHFNQSGAPYRPGDADGDGLVNFNDYFAVRANFNATLATLTYDFGDAPTAAQSGQPASYPTTLADNGARHVVTGNTLLLGAARDAEADGLPDGSASADGADDDGIDIADLEPGTTVGVTVTASGVTTTAFLNAWIDWNADGDWSDSGEHVFLDEPLTTGANTLSIHVPVSASIGATYARFRLTETGGYSFTGLAPSGEVEDNLLTITAPELLSPQQEPISPSAANSKATDRSLDQEPAGLSLITLWTSGAGPKPVPRRLDSDKERDDSEPLPSPASLAPSSKAAVSGGDDPEQSGKGLLRSRTAESL